MKEKKLKLKQFQTVWNLQVREKDSKSLNKNTNAFRLRRPKSRFFIVGLFISSNVVFLKMVHKNYNFFWKMVPPRLKNLLFIITNCFEDKWNILGFLLGLFIEKLVLNTSNGVSKYFLKYIVCSYLYFENLAF